MRRLLVLALVLAACRQREEAKPTPEGKPSAAPPPVEYALEKLTCTNGRLGVVLAPPAAIASSSALPSLPADAGGLFAPIGDGGLGIGTIGGSGFGVGLGAGLARMMRAPIVAVPVDARGARALAVAKGVCPAFTALRTCHDDHEKPTGHVLLALEVDGAGKIAKAKRESGEGLSAPLDECVVRAISALTLDPTAEGVTRYKISFEPPRRVVPPTLKETGATVKGSLAPEVIRRIMRASMPRLRYCYNSALQRDPALEGKLTLGFTIDTKGDTKDATIVDGTIADATMRTCVLAATAKITFPTPKSGEVFVKYPLEFKPGTP